MTGSELNKLGDDFTANKGGAVVVKDGLAIVVLLKSDTITCLALVRISCMAMSPKWLASPKTTPS